MVAPRHLHPITTAFVAAAAASGLRVSADLNGAVREGVGLAPSNIRDGARWSVVEGYLAPAMARDNLTVRLDSPAVLVLDGTSAVGIRTAGPRPRPRPDAAQVRARKGVVVCAGAVRTPHLLMLAGIGPAAHLRDHGIDVAGDLPGVGANLYDHPVDPTIWPLTNGAALRDASYANPQATYGLLRRRPRSARAWPWSPPPPRCPRPTCRCR